MLSLFATCVMIHISWMFCALVETDSTLCQQGGSDPCETIEDQVMLLQVKMQVEQDRTSSPSSSSSSSPSVVYQYGAAAQNDCPFGFDNVLTISDCQAAGVALAVNTDNTLDDQTHLQDDRPKGCFGYVYSDGWVQMYFNPNPGVPKQPNLCSWTAWPQCMPICKSWTTDQKVAAMEAEKDKVIAGKDKVIAEKDEMIAETLAFAPGPGWCHPYGASGGDLCQEHPGQPACSTVDTSTYYLPGSCDASCARQLCIDDTLCVGYNSFETGGGTVFKLKSKITAVYGGSKYGSDYMCFRKV